MPLVTTPTIALVGNPNTGKTTLFNALAGMRQRVGNYPGVTVETKKGQFRHHDQSFTVIDLPGTYSLAPRSPDEMVAVDVILGKQQGELRPDLVVTIVDASNMERNLYLATQALELGVPVVVALNMMDVAESQGIRIDVEQLSAQLGVPVIPIQANRGKGIERLRQTIGDCIDASPPGKMPTYPEAFEKEISALREIVGPDVSTFLLRRLLIDVGGYVEDRMLDRFGAELGKAVKAARQRLADAGCAVPAVEARTRYTWIRAATAGCISRPEQRRATLTDHLDTILTHKIWGTFIFLALMLLVFVSIFWLAQIPSGWIKQGKAWLEGLVTNDAFMQPGPLRSLLTKGVIGGVGGVLVFLPQIMILFAFIAILEDCGYMARAAFLMDKLMARCGLSGKSFIPMLSSIACAVPGIMAARVIENRRDRFATILVAPLMSCSARLPVYFLLIAAFLSTKQGYPFWVPGVTLFAMYMIGLIVAPAVALVLKRTVLKGETPAFVMEMPSYKIPSLTGVLHRMFEAGWLFTRRAGTIILATMIIVWALLYFTLPGPQDGIHYDTKIAALNQTLEEKREEQKELDQQLTDQGKENRIDLQQKKEQLDAQIALLTSQINTLEAQWSQNSILGQAGKAIEPVLRPLGWDWRIGMAALASFPAREVFVGTMGIIYNQGEADTDDEEFKAGLGDAMRSQSWDDDPSRKVFNVPVALSVMVFFALCCQCASTLAVIKRETNSWKWPVFTFVYMTGLAYIGALLVYQVSSLIV